MRTLAIGDIHGCFDALQNVLALARVSKGERVILLGDLVDRGPSTREVIQWAIDNPLGLDLHVLRGNHECMMLTSRTESWYYDNWLAVGGKEVLASYADSEDFRNYWPPKFSPEWKELVPDEHWGFIQSRTLRYFETETEIFVHGGLSPNLVLEQQKEEELFWASFHGAVPHFSGKRMICGHTSQKSGRPRNLGYAVCIDTNACRGGWLTCLDVETNDYWQSNQDGDFREGDLRDDD